MQFAYQGETLSIIQTQYHDGNTAVQVVDADGAPYATISVNLPESKGLSADMFYVKDWSENEALVHHLYDKFILIQSRSVEPIRSGFVFVHAAWLAKNA